MSAESFDFPRNPFSPLLRDCFGALPLAMTVWLVPGNDKGTTMGKGLITKTKRRKPPNFGGFLKSYVLAVKPNLTLLHSSSGPDYQD